MNFMLRSTLAGLALIVPSFSLAQTVKKGDLSYSTPSCTFVSRGTVDCRLTVTYTGKEAASRIVVWTQETKAYDAAGATYISVSGTGGGEESANQLPVDLPKGIPVQVVHRFAGLPGTLTGFRGLAFDGISFQNLPFKSTAAVPAPAPLPASTGVPTGFNVTLSRCSPQGASYLCTATLTPVR
ncbi:hypothetical protein K7W42_16710 [Deinococcus sp. HMF7604]|uniref:hypothetical protein n=1 Tax=Deinococcus betulae TaxID=2873312 RepID=UPI001CCC9D31|nr:hypothetical protein [Deinococcus betulae]MBZ9752491.1 hypothetical protein [Deinococcus betulae]